MSSFSTVCDILIFLPYVGVKEIYEPLSTLFSLFFPLSVLENSSFFSCISQLYMLHAMIASVLYLGDTIFSWSSFSTRLTLLFFIFYSSVSK